MVKFDHKKYTHFRITGIIHCKKSGISKQFKG